MANDDRINVRVSIQEYRMDMLLEIVEEIRANYVSKAYLNEVVSHLATKEDLRLMATKEDLKQYATREDLKQYATKEDLKLLATKEDLKLYATKEDLKLYATKEDLRQVEQNMRNWLIGLFFTLFFSLSAMQFAMFQLFRHTS